MSVRTMRPRRRPLHPLLILPALLAAPAGCGDGEAAVMVAVASSFAATHEALAASFEDWTGVPVRTVVGSTGQIHAQIRNGAPVDVFLAADRERPRRLEEEGRAVPGSRFTYALGRLALYGSAEVRPIGSLGRIGDSGWIVALADARVAPYGQAAEEVLGRLGLDETLRERTVRAESVGQVHRFVLSGAAEVGFVALAQVVDEPADAWLPVPDSLHAPIRQDAVLLDRAAENPAAVAWMDFLRSAEAARIIRERGYGTPREHP